MEILTPETITYAIAGLGAVAAGIGFYFECLEPLMSLSPGSYERQILKSDSQRDIFPAIRQALTSEEDKKRIAAALLDDRMRD